LTETEEFLEEFEEKVAPEIRVQALDTALKATPMSSWGTHKQHIGS